MKNANENKASVSQFLSCMHPLPIELFNNILVFFLSKALTKELSNLFLVCKAWYQQVKMLLVQTSYPLQIDYEIALRLAKTIENLELVVYKLTTIDSRPSFLRDIKKSLLIKNRLNDVNFDIYDELKHALQPFYLLYPNLNYLEKKVFPLFTIFFDNFLTICQRPTFILNDLTTAQKKILFLNCPIFVLIYNDSNGFLVSQLIRISVINFSTWDKTTYDDLSLKQEKLTDEETHRLIPITSAMTFQDVQNNFNQIFAKVLYFQCGQTLINGKKFSRNIFSLSLLKFYLKSIFKLADDVEVNIKEYLLTIFNKRIGLEKQDKKTIVVFRDKIDSIEEQALLQSNYTFFYYRHTDSHVLNFTSPPKIYENTISSKSN